MKATKPGHSAYRLRSKISVTPLFSLFLKKRRRRPTPKGDHHREEPCHPNSPPVSVVAQLQREGSVQQLLLGCSAKIHLVVSREMNWAVVQTVFKAMVALGAVTFFVVSKAGGPEEAVEQAIQLAESDPFRLLVYTFCAEVATSVIYAMISLAIAFDSPDSARRQWW